ncbi:MAG: formyltetrahydrofolate deformylase [Rhodospirillaceae bacterium]|nr:formyltetrahydrofolate deformylase [Rhodospirillaceae bacterium]
MDNAKSAETKSKSAGEDRRQPGRHVILTLSCDDRPGIVAAVAGNIAGNGGNIVESAQYGDGESGRFFMRVRFELLQPVSLDELKERMQPVARAYDMEWGLTDAAAPSRVLILVSRFDHCMNDLLYKTRIGALPMQVVGVASNHRDFADRIAAEGYDFYHLPITPETKAEQEAKLLSLVEETGAELVVLARYMQILTDETARALTGRAINIHHSFLPSFKGARPYQQAHRRGVKLIGATAHYVTGDLDEGPIIEQETERVDHSMTADELVAVGRDIECRVLARAVKFHVERRVLLNGSRTVVFR